MGATPIPPQSPPEPAKPAGKKQFHLSCVYHGEVGVAASLEAAQQQAAEHLKTAHPALVADKSEGAEVLIQEVLHYGILDVLALLEHSAG